MELTFRPWKGQTDEKWNFDGWIHTPRGYWHRPSNFEIYKIYEEISHTKCHFSHSGSCIRTPNMHVSKNRRKLHRFFCKRDLPDNRMRLTMTYRITNQQFWPNNYLQKVTDRRIKFSVEVALYLRDSLKHRNWSLHQQW